MQVGTFYYLIILIGVFPYYISFLIYLYEIASNDASFFL